MTELKRVLVSGGAGFIGSHLCKRLINDGCYVICMDNLFTGSKRNIVIHKLEVGVIHELRNIALRAGKEVVHADYIAAVINQAFA